MGAAESSGDSSAGGWGFGNGGYFDHTDFSCVVYVPMKKNMPITT
jgi:hypothetical protein